MSVSDRHSTLTPYICSDSEIDIDLHYAIVPGKKPRILEPNMSGISHHLLSLKAGLQMHEVLLHYSDIYRGNISSVS